MTTTKTLTLAKRLVSFAIVLVSIGLGLYLLAIPLFYAFRQPLLDFASQYISQAETLYLQEKLIGNNFFLELASLLAPILSIIVTLFFLINSKKLLTNVLEERIFTSDNVAITKKVSFLMLIVAALPEIDSYGISFNIDFIFLTAALLIWVFSLVLEKANSIAQENEFTI